jgi:hypothetical protein
MGDEWSQIPREGTDPSSVDLLRVEFPFDAPPRSVLRRCRAALLTGAVLLPGAFLLPAGLRVGAFVRVRTMAACTSDAGGSRGAGLRPPGPARSS